MNTKTIEGTYGSNETPCDIFVAEDNNSGLSWYVVEGSQNVNATYEYLEDGCDVELVRDVDCFTGICVNSEEELIEAIEE